MGFNSLEAQGVNITTAQELLELKGSELSMFGAAVEENCRKCDAMDGCSTANCSRLACQMYGIPVNPNYECMPVLNNTLCMIPGNALCQERSFDFGEAYLRRVDPIDDHIARTVCTHRSLVDHFRNSTVADPKHFFRVYFGAVDGTTRVYSGADENCEDLYDPRVRPWYLESINVPKVVSVLIDCGLNMRTNISAGNDETYISKGIATALRFLDTLREDQDYVTIMCFDGDGIKYLKEPVMYNKGLLYQSFSDSLVDIVVNGSKSDPTAAQTNDAINTTVNQMSDLTNGMFPAGYLKVVIALIGGQQFEAISDLNFSVIPNMNVFIYNFRTQVEPQCNPDIRVSLETIPADRLNSPLFALQSYYSFLAKLHRNFMKSQIDFGPHNQDFDGIDNQTLTLSKAAFGPSGELLGVLGLDIFQHLVQEQFPTIQFQTIVEEAGKHDPGRLFDTALDLNVNVCFNHTDACPGLDETFVQGFLCEKAASPDESIACCGTCKVSLTPPSTTPPAMPPGSLKKKTTSWHMVAEIVGGALGGVFLLLFVIAMLVMAARRRDRTKSTGSSSASANGEWTGTEEDP